LVGVRQHIFTCPTAALATTDFQGVRNYAHLYSFDPDLEIGRLFEPGDTLDAPETFEPTEEQKEALYESFVYKSLLNWAPRHAEEDLSQV